MRVFLVFRCFSGEAFFHFDHDLCAAPNRVFHLGRWICLFSSVPWCRLLRTLEPPLHTSDSGPPQASANSSFGFAAVSLHPFRIAACVCLRHFSLV